MITRGVDVAAGVRDDKGVTVSRGVGESFGVAVRVGVLVMVGVAVTVDVFVTVGVAEGNSAAFTLFADGAASATVYDRMQMPRKTDHTIMARRLLIFCPRLRSSS